MKKLTCIALGFVLGSLTTIFVVRSNITNESQSKRTAEASESKLNFDFSVPMAWFHPKTHEDFLRADRFSLLRQGRDYSSVRLPDFNREIPSQEAHDTDIPYLIHNNEWKKRDYGLYVLPPADL
ncbi:MAG: hypothetical protein KDK99_22595 [Verrucomicrobiales bacterium]|nr:hypothetical protein [Verrucomicrobiales bacterium]